MPGSVAWVLRPSLRREVDRLVPLLSARGVDPALIVELRDFLAGVEQVAEAWQAWRISAGGSAEMAPAEVRAGSAHESISTADAAALLGVTPRRVVQLLHDGALAGRQVGRTWSVDRESVRLRSA